MKRLIVIDALNMYFRAYIVDPSLSTNGQPIGGIKGSLRILQKLCREVKPTKVFICWDGREGSSKRKSQKSGYKEGRKKPLRLNRDVTVLSDEEEIKNKIWQQSRLMEYFNTLPVSQILIEHMEADDVIAVLCGLYKDTQKVIVSSDKDFFQLCDNETVVLRPIQKEVVNQKSLVEQYGIAPQNFALARAIAGDKSDNLPGIGGVGLPTVSKRFPFLAENISFGTDSLVIHAEENKGNVKAYTSVIEHQDLIRENYRLMQLYIPSLSVQGRKKIDYALENFEPELAKTNVKMMMIEDGFGAVNFIDLYAAMNKIVADSKL